MQINFTEEVEGRTWKVLFFQQDCMSCSPLCQTLSSDFSVQSYSTVSLFSHRLSICSVSLRACTSPICYHFFGIILLFDSMLVVNSINHLGISSYQSNFSSFLTFPHQMAFFHLFCKCKIAFVKFDIYFKQFKLEKCFCISSAVVLLMSE